MSPGDRRCRCNDLGQGGIRSGAGVFRLHIDHLPATRLRQLRGYANRALPPFWLAARRTGWQPTMSADPPAQTAGTRDIGCRPVSRPCAARHFS